MMGLYFDEIEPGQRFELGSYAFEREAMLTFARRYDPQPFHLSDEAAAASHFGRLTASGWHTAAGWMKCFVAANDRARALRAANGELVPEIGPSPGFTKLKWLKPVYVDDVLSYSAEVTAKSEHSRRPEWGFVDFHNEGINQHGELVFSFEGKVLVRRR